MWYTVHRYLARCTESNGAKQRSRLPDAPIRTPFSTSSLSPSAADRPAVSVPSRAVGGDSARAGCRRAVSAAPLHRAGRTRPTVRRPRHRARVSRQGTPRPAGSPSWWRPHDATGARQLGRSGTNAAHERWTAGRAERRERSSPRNSAVEELRRRRFRAT